MSSLTRMLSVLDLFSRAHTTMTAEEIADALGLTRTTCYRYTRELGQAGLLLSTGGHFMLGPRIIELDRKIIESDPLLNAGREIVVGMADALKATGLLSTSYEEQIINIFQYEGTAPERPLSFGRGTTMPIFRTSTSKVILAAMSRGRLKRLWGRHQNEPDCVAIGPTWLAFWKALQIIRRQGYWISRQEGDFGLAGISAPILYESGDVAGAISLVFSAEAFKVFDASALGERMIAAAARIAAQMTAEIPD